MSHIIHEEEFSSSDEKDTINENYDATYFTPKLKPPESNAAATDEFERATTNFSVTPNSFHHHKQPIMRSPSLINLTSLTLVFQFLPFIHHLQAAQVSYDWWRTACSKLAWVEELPNLTNTDEDHHSQSSYPHPCERPSKMVCVRSYSDLLALTRSSLTTHIHTLAIDLRFDFSTNVSHALVTLPSLTSLTLNVADNYQVSHAGVATCFANNAANGWANRLREVCIGEVSLNGPSKHQTNRRRATSTTLSPHDTSISSLARGISLDYFVTSVHLLSLYLSHLDNLEVLIHSAYHHLDYTMFEELRGMDKLHTLIISRQLPHSQERLENIRRLPNLTYLDWCGDAWTKESNAEVKENENGASQIVPSNQCRNSWQLLFTPISLPCIDEVEHMGVGDMPSYLPFQPHRLRSVTIHSAQFTLDDLSSLVYILPTLEILHLSSDALFELTGLDILSALERAWKSYQNVAEFENLSLHSSSARSPITLPLHTLSIERYHQSHTVKRSDKHPRSWEIKHRAGSIQSSDSFSGSPISSSPPTRPITRALSLDSVAIPLYPLDVPSFRLTHFTLSTNLLISSTDWIRTIHAMPELHTMQLQDLSLSASMIYTLACLPNLATLILDHCTILKPSSGSCNTYLTKLIKNRSISAGVMHTLVLLPSLTHLELRACTELLGKDLIILYQSPKLKLFLWSNSTYLNELVDPLSSSPSTSPIHVRPISPSSSHRHGLSWNSDYITLQRLKNSINPTRYPLPSSIAPLVRRASLVQRLKGLAQAALGGSPTSCLEATMDEEQFDSVFASSATQPSSSPESHTPFSPSTSPSTSPCSPQLGRHHHYSVSSVPTFCTNGLSSTTSFTASTCASAPILTGRTLTVLLRNLMDCLPATAYQSLPINDCLKQQTSAGADDLSLEPFLNI